MSDLAKAYQLPTPNEWEVQLLDVLVSLGMDSINKTLGAGTNVVVVDPILLREYIAVVRDSSSALPSMRLMMFLKQISELSDQARRDTGRLSPEGT